MSDAALYESKARYGIPGKRKKKRVSLAADIKKNVFLYLLVLPGVFYFILFKYLPMVGIVIAFEDFSFVKGIFRSRFVGLKNFEFFFSSRDWIQVTFNTIYLNILFIATGLFFSILIAIVLSEITGTYFRKITQSLVILPNFISWTIVAMFTFSLCATDIGFINTTLKAFHLEPLSFYSTPGIWPVLLVLLKIWKGAGFGSVVYLAAIAGIDQEIYEAARIDGASRLQCIRRITLPQLRSTAVLLTLFAVGGIFHGDFGLIYALVGDNPLLYSTTDIIDTYVYRQLRQLGEISMSAAVGFYQSFVGFIIVVAANKLANKIDKDSAIF
jgi:putative aldouronate transport system permease protein